jgi:predicted transcriptional regulator
MRQQVNLRIDSNLVTRLDAQAERLHSTRNYVIEVLIREGLVALEHENVFRVIGAAIESRTSSALSPVESEMDAELRTTEQIAKEHVEETIAEIAQDPGPKQVEQEDPWGPFDHTAEAKVHKFHRFDALIPKTVEYRNGVQFGFHECVCGAIEENKTKVRKQ